MDSTTLIEAYRPLLARDQFLLVNTYPRKGSWGVYGVDAAAASL